MSEMFEFISQSASFYSAYPFFKAAKQHSTRTTSPKTQNPYQSNVVANKYCLSCGYRDLLHHSKRNLLPIVLIAYDNQLK